MAKFEIRVQKPKISGKKTTGKVSASITESSTDLVFDWIDEDFLKLIYFQDDKEKSDYLTEVRQILQKLSIKKGSDIVKVRNKIADYLLENENIKIDFLFEVLKERQFEYIKNFNHDESDYQISDLKEINTAVTNKISGYYNALRFGITNIKRKLKHSFYDFTFEENLILAEVKKVQRAFSMQKKEFVGNYILIDAFYHIGLIHFRSGNVNKASEYFDLIRKTKFQLSEYSKSEFYKKIGKLYFEEKMNKEALSWLKEGVKINPKLTVKKLIEKLSN